MLSLIQHVESSARTIIAIETVDGEVFGSFTSSPWRPHGTDYFGNGEAFLWRVIRLPSRRSFNTCEIEVFPWTGLNHNVQFLERNDSDLGVGGGVRDDDSSIDSRGSGLVISSCLSRGVSDPCETFNNPSLSATREFEIRTIEVWTMTPASTEDQAEQLERSRQFLFEHGKGFGSEKAGQFYI